MGKGGVVNDGHFYSVELCGGTHVRATGDIALFKIISESAVSSGIRRIEALTGEAARLWLSDREDRLRQSAAALKTTPEDVPARIAALVEQSRKLERELAEAKKALALGGGASGAAPAGPEQVGAIAFLAQVIDGLDPKELRGIIDGNKKVLGSGVSAIVAVVDGRATIAIGVTDDLTATISAVDLVRAGVEALGGKGGGGRPDMAQGGGPEGDKAPAAIEAVKAALAAVPA
jgi:alanyl-tRNA synthetase